MQVGMIGLGRMGANMTRRLLRGGHECVVYDRAEAAAQLAETVKILRNDFVDRSRGAHIRENPAAGTFEHTAQAEQPPIDHVARETVFQDGQLCTQLGGARQS